MNCKNILSRIKELTEFLGDYLKLLRKRSKCKYIQLFRNLDNQKKQNGFVGKLEFYSYWYQRIDHILYVLFFVLCPILLGATNPIVDTTAIINERVELLQDKDKQLLLLQEKLAYQNAILVRTDIPIEKRFEALLAVRDLEKAKNNLDLTFDLKFSEFRYRKGIEILKMIYEKILALDHHFTSLRTFQDIHELSNPNSFPEFSRAKNYLKEDVQTKTSVELPAILDSNPIISLSYTVISSLIGTSKKVERKKEIDDIACLLDFTVSMHSDLKIIYYETEYIKNTNQELRLECEKLFEDYTKTINYENTLDHCRLNDDWDNLFESLDQLIAELDNESSDVSSNRKRFITKLHSLEFSVNRLISFIDSYNKFVGQGEQYYRKFLVILNNYENKSRCISELPKEVVLLEKEIKDSIRKFSTAYNMAELQGSKLRDLLYGSP